MIIIDRISKIGKIFKSIQKQEFVELYTQRLKEKNINTKNLRAPKAETP